MWPYAEVLDEIDDVKSIDILLDIAFSTLKNLDIPRFIYVFLPQDTHFNQGVIDVLHRGYHDKLLVIPEQLETIANMDVGAKYLKLKAASSTSAFTERDYLAESLFTSVEPPDPKDNYHWNLRAGLIIPVHSAHSNMGFSVFLINLLNQIQNVHASCICYVRAFIRNIANSGPCPQIVRSS